MDKYTVSELVQKFGYPESKIRRRIRKGLLPTIKEKDGHQEVTKVLVESEELLTSVIEGRDIQSVSQDRILVGCSERQEVKEAEFIRHSSDFQYQDNNQIFETPVVMELIGQLKDSQKHFIEYNTKLSDLHNQLVGYAELAGQAKLLTDSEHKTKEAYFKLQQENKQLREERIELKMKLEQLQEKFEGQKEVKKNFFDVLFRRN